MAAKNIMGGNPNPGKGTRLAEYVETPVAKKCGTCKYLVHKTLCQNHQTIRDSQIPKDLATGFRIVDPVDGLCRFWRPSDEALGKK